MAQDQVDVPFAVAQVRFHVLHRPVPFQVAPDVVQANPLKVPIWQSFAVVDPASAAVTVPPSLWSTQLQVEVPVAQVHFHVLHKPVPLQVAPPVVHADPLRVPVWQSFVVDPASTVVMAPASLRSTQLQVEVALAQVHFHVLHVPVPAQVSPAVVHATPSYVPVPHSPPAAPVFPAPPEPVLVALVPPGPPPPVTSVTAPQLTSARNKGGIKAQMTRGFTWVFSERGPVPRGSHSDQRGKARRGRATRLPPSVETPLEAITARVENAKDNGGARGSSTGLDVTAGSASRDAVPARGKVLCVLSEMPPPPDHP